MIQDFRFAIRLLIKERWYTAVAVLALALGIGVNATVYAIVDAALFRPLPFKDADRLYMLDWQVRSGVNPSVSHTEVQDWRAQNRSFTDIAAYRTGTINISGDQSWPEQARGAWVSANAFALLGHQPVIGRGFIQHDERRGAERVVVLGHRVWQNRYGGDRNVLGQTIRLNAWSGKP